MKLATTSAIAVAAIIFGVAVVVVLFAGSWTAIASEDVKLFPSERDAAYAASSNVKTEPAISTVKQGETVTVVRDTYGKDYWACQIRTSTNQYGWVLCTALKRTT